jgi:hypothetical protein
MNFVNNHSQDINFEKIEFPMNEFIKIDSSGRVIKTYLYPAYSD